MNLLHVLNAGNGYNVSKGLLKSTKKEQQWTYDDKDYVKTSDDFKYKSRIVKRTVKDENSQSRTVEEKVVVYWSMKFQAGCERENKKSWISWPNWKNPRSVSQHGTAVQKPEKVLQKGLRQQKTLGSYGFL